MQDLPSILVVTESILRSSSAAASITVRSAPVRSGRVGSGQVRSAQLSSVQLSRRSRSGSSGQSPPHTSFKWPAAAPPLRCSPGGQRIRPVRGASAHRPMGGGRRTGSAPSPDVSRDSGRRAIMGGREAAAALRRRPSLRRWQRGERGRNDGETRPAAPAPQNDGTFGPTYGRWAPRHQLRLGISPPPKKRFLTQRFLLSKFVFD